MLHRREMFTFTTHTPTDAIIRSGIWSLKCCRFSRRPSVYCCMASNIEIMASSNLSMKSTFRRCRVLLRVRRHARSVLRIWESRRRLREKGVFESLAYALLRDTCWFLIAIAVLMTTSNFRWYAKMLLGVKTYICLDISFAISLFDPRPRMGAPPTLSPDYAMQNFMPWYIAELDADGRAPIIVNQRAAKQPRE